MKMILKLSLAILLFIPSLASANDLKNSTEQARLQEAQRDKFLLFFDQMFCGPRIHTMTMTRSHESQLPSCPTHYTASDYALVPYDPFFSIEFPNTTLASALILPSFNGIQKILEANKLHRDAGMVAEAATFIKIARNLYKAFHSNKTLSNSSFYTDMACDAGLLGAGYLLFGGHQAAGIGRVGYNLLKAPSTLNSEMKKISKRGIPDSLLSTEGFEFLRHASLGCAEIANLVLRFYGNNPALTGILGYKALNRAYEFATEYNTQSEFQLTKTMIYSAVIGSIIAMQAPAQYYAQPQYVALLLTFEYILTALFTYDGA